LFKLNTDNNYDYKTIDQIQVGDLIELDDYLILLVITIDKLEQIVQLTQNFNSINEEFSFEYELDNLNF
jgi:hypothetical protein